MSDTSTLTIKVSPIEKSRFKPFENDNLVMGRNFTDHMLVCDYENGAWKTPEIVPYGDMAMSPALAALHYGQSIFEGVKAYRQPDGSVAIFRPDANWARMNVSAKRMDMPKIPKEIFIDGLRKLLEIDNQWIPGFPETSLYIRPFMFSTDAFIGVKTSDNYRFCIICSPAGKYYAKPVNIYVQDEFVRAVPGGIGFTKAAGNYGASMYPTHQVKEKGYDQILWTDAFEHKYVQEIGTMNVFFIIDGKAVTPDLNSGTILAGITRDSIITLFKQNGIEVEERPIDINELVAAYKEGKLQEAFGSGTAASMSYIQSLTYKGETLKLKDVSEWTISPKIKALLDDIRYGRIADENKWRFTV
jgi:branched-chain amino acid aminotransferase